MEYYEKVIQGKAAMALEDVKINDDFEKIFHLGLEKAKK